MGMIDHSVHLPLFLLLFTVVSVVGVVIEADPMDVLANIMDTVNFTCLVSGSENITYTWFHGNGTGVELTSRTAGVSSPTLTISPVVSSDFGEYFCTASNNVNSVQSRSALLTGLSLPPCISHAYHRYITWTSCGHHMHVPCTSNFHITCMSHIQYI